MKYFKLTTLMILMIASNQICAQKLTKYDPKVEWTDFFKHYATFKCICEITNEEIIASMDKHKDMSFWVTRDILQSHKESADTAGRNFAKRIPIVSTEKGSDFYNHRLSMYSCLEFAKSAELDSIASKHYEIFIKSYANEWLKSH